MRHRKAVKRLSRNTSNRKALLRSLARGLIISERISTTYVRAKEASSLADKLINLGKKNTITSKKTAISILGSKMLINRLFNEIAPRYANRKGGYTRILQLAPRKGDGAKMALLELTERKIVEKPLTKKSDKKTKEEKKEKELDKPIPKAEKKELGKPTPKEEKPLPTTPPKTAPVTTKEKIDKEKLDEEKSKERAKSEKEKLQRGFFKGLRHYFQRKSF
jgi:large subunit ribosomal protein L17